MAETLKSRSGVQNNVESRVARLEEAIDSVRGEVHGLTISIRDLSSKISKTSETNWSVYFSGLGVLLAFVLAVGGGALAPLYLMANNNSQQLSASIAMMIERIDGKIDGVNTIREGKLKHIDEVFQREMRLLNDAQDTDAHYLEEQIRLLRESVSKISDRLRNHEQIDGHPTAMAMHNAATEKFTELNRIFAAALKELDVKLQREMELADMAQKERLKGLNDKLHLEIISLKELMREVSN